MAERHMAQLRTHLRFPCEQSTSLIGAVDPMGLLEPGYIHVCSSEPFEEENQSRASLDRMEVLVTQHYTLRGSDLHKVKAVFVPKLAHLKDVVVFPSKGRIPPAAKLQMLAKPPSIGDFGIVQRGEKLGSLSTDPSPTEEQVGKWLNDVLAFKYHGDLLGLVTNHFYKLAYHENNLWPPPVLAVAGLHDLLVDTAKNGYVFTRHMLNEYLQKKGYRFPKEVEDPAWAATTKEPTRTSRSLREAIHRPRPKKPAHVLDHIMFTAICPLLVTTLDRLQASADAAVYRDEDLEYAYKQAPSLASTEVRFEFVVLAEIALITRRVVQIQELWGSIVSAVKDTGADYGRTYLQKCIKPCWEQYEAIEPCNSSHPLLAGWLSKSASQGLRFWDVLRVSVLARRFPDKPKFTFAVARDVLCKIKAESTEDSRLLCLDMAGIMKVKKIERAVDIEEAQNSANNPEVVEAEADNLPDWDGLDDADLLAVAVTSTDAPFKRTMRGV